MEKPDRTLCTAKLLSMTFVENPRQFLRFTDWERDALAEQSKNSSLQNDKVEVPTMKDGKQMVCKYLSVRIFRISKFQQRSSQVLHKGPLEAAVSGHENCLLLSIGWRKWWAKLKFT